MPFTKSTLHTARVNKKNQEIIFEFNLFARKIIFAYHSKIPALEYIMKPFESCSNIGSILLGYWYSINAMNSVGSQGLKIKIYFFIFHCWGFLKQMHFYTPLPYRKHSMVCSNTVLGASEGKVTREINR